MVTFHLWLSGIYICVWVSKLSLSFSQQFSALRHNWSNWQNDLATRADASWLLLFLVLLFFSQDFVNSQGKGSSFHLGDVSKLIQLLTIMPTIFFTIGFNYFSVFFSFFFFDSSSSSLSSNAVSFFLTTDVCHLLDQACSAFYLFQATQAKFGLHASNMKFLYTK